MRKILLMALLFSACKTEYEKGMEALQLENPVVAMEHFQKVSPKDVAYIAAQNQIGRYWYALADEAYNSRDFALAKKYAGQVPSGSSSAFQAAILIKTSDYLSEPEYPVTIFKSDTTSHFDTTNIRARLGLDDWLYIQCGGKPDGAGKIICSDQELIDLDSTVGKVCGGLYQEALKADMANDANMVFSKELEKSQAEWDKERDKCSDKDCIMTAYRDRLSVLKNMSHLLSSETNH